MNVWPVIAERLAVHDPGNQYAVNYMWGTVGVGFNVKKVREILGPDAVIDSWSLVFDPAKLAKFKDCGIHMLDSPDDILPAALHYLGRNPNSVEPADLEAAERLCTHCGLSVGAIDFIGDSINEINGCGTIFTEYKFWQRIVDARPELVSYFRDVLAKL